jgi:hypothetical protein
MPGMRERNLAEIRRVNEIEEVVTTDRIVARIDGADRDAQPRQGCGRIGGPVLIRSGTTIPLGL